MLKKPTTKSVTSAAVQIGSGVAGAKLSDGVVAILPDSLGKAKKPLLALVALGVAASVNASSTGGQIVQAACAGMAIKQGTDAVTEAIIPMIAPKDNTKALNRFLNGVIGHNNTTASTVERFAQLNATSMDWQGAQEMFELNQAIPEMAYPGL